MFKDFEDLPLAGELGSVARQQWIKNAQGKGSFARVTKMTAYIVILIAD